VPLERASAGGEAGLLAASLTLGWAKPGSPARLQAASQTLLAAAAFAKDAQWWWACSGRACQGGGGGALLLCFVFEPAHSRGGVAASIARLPAHPTGQVSFPNPWTALGWASPADSASAAIELLPSVILVSFSSHPCGSTVATWPGELCIPPLARDAC
jgi:hypothetical protein